MTANEIVDRSKITGVWRALGGPALRNGRGPAFWRAGDGYHVSLDDAKGAWCDHARGDGGGVLDLIQTVLGVSRQAALRWLADYLHVDIGDPPSPAERRAFAQRREFAETKARLLTEWRGRLLERLTRSRNAYFDADRQICNWALRNLDNPILAADTDLWDRIYAETSAWARHAAECEALIATIRTMAPRDLLALQRQFGPIRPDAIEEAVNRYLFDLESQLRKGSSE